MTNLIGHIIQVRLSTSLTLFVNKVVKILLLLKNCLFGAKSNLDQAKAYRIRAANIILNSNHIISEVV